MTSIEVGILGIVLLLVLLIIRVPVGIAMIIAALAGNVILSAPGPALTKLGIDTILIAQNHSFSVIPFFVFMGMILARANIGADLYEVINGIIGRIRGGMAMATVGAGAAFGAVCGSCVASVTTIAAVAVPEMRKYKYDEGFAAGVTAVGSTLGIVIPPSTALVVYGALTEESIGQVLIGGILPGILTMILLMLTVTIVLKWKPALAPPPVKGEKIPFPWEKLKYIWAVPLIFLLSMGGIYFGFFTPTEAGAVGAFLSLLFAVLMGRLKWREFVEAVEGTIRISAMVFIILIGGKMFGSFLTRSLIPMELVEFIQGLNVPPFFIIMIILLIYTLMGPIMDEMATLVIMTPIVYPIVTALGYNGIWFGVMTIMMLLTGLLTPPVGVVSLVASSVTKVPAMKVFMSQWPFWITLIIACVLMAIFPEIILILPRMMYQ
ncbi:MAG: TRAP transporter large permease [Firmicutes bacterium]|jgi:tripartite ATP-independent transporter DctM subunit|nr:TRAP transporter large permease [Bacillota bacterium]HPU01534.1 TRAP transporter large permease [Bacillota bacterium]